MHDNVYNNPLHSPKKTKKESDKVQIPKGLFKNIEKKVLDAIKEAFDGQGIDVNDYEIGVCVTLKLDLFIELEKGIEQ